MNTSTLLRLSGGMMLAGGLLLLISGITLGQWLLPTGGTLLMVAGLIMLLTTRRSGTRRPG
ncbi:MAG: hypothetical protein QM286_12240 [Acidobacteriota bacterium]|nr:hypothetical protein [Acidobacteriota bacterium]